MRKVDEPQHPINHRITKRDERVDGAEGKSVNELLEELDQAELMVES
jgi:hypothetical protein